MPSLKKKMLNLTFFSVINTNRDIISQINVHPFNSKFLYFINDILKRISKL